MDYKTKQALVNELSRASTTNVSVTIEHEGRPLAVVMPITDYEKFEEERRKKLASLKTELNGLLSLVRSHVHHQSLEEVESRLAALRHKIEQEEKE